MLPPLRTREEGSQTPFCRKLAFASCSPARANQPSKVGLPGGHTACPFVGPSLSPLPHLPHPQLMELSCPEHMNGSLQSQRDLGALRGIQDCRDTPANATSKQRTLPASLYPTAVSEDLWSQESLSSGMGQHWPPPIPWGSSGKLGRLREGQCLIGGMVQIKPHSLTTGQSGATLGFGDHLCSQKSGGEETRERQV